MFMGIRAGIPNTAQQVGDLRSAVIAALFGGGEQGALYDPSDLSTLYQDSAGTTPVTADGQPVGRMEDLSGNGNHATQTTSASRPLYKTDGTLHWLEFDGVDDYLSFTYSSPITQPNTMYAGFSVDDVDINSGYFGSIASTGDTRQLVYRAGGGPKMFAGKTAPTFDLTSGETAVMVFEFNGASSRLLKNSEAAITGDSGTNTGDGEVLGAQYATPSGFAPINLYAFASTSVIPDDQTVAQAWLASKAGIIL